MFRIPPQGKHSQPNNSDLFGTIHYSKCIDLDEEGYIKLSPRSVSLINSESSTTFNIPLAFGRLQSGQFKVATTERAFNIQISDDGGTYTATEDTDNGTNPPPAFDFDSHGKWWQNRWYVTDATVLMYKTISDGDWTDTSLNLTSGVRHPIEVFKNRVTLCVGNVNSVKQLNTSHTETTNLTIPTDFQVTCLAHNGRYMAVGTKLADTTSGVTGINGEAQLFIWDGATTSANQSWGVGSDMIVDIKPYKSSFVLLTRNGQLLYWNGGGVTQLAALSIWYTKRTWGDSVNFEALGDILTVDGDIVYINVNSSSEPYGRKGEEVLPNGPGGILCYDPAVGIYHRYAPSISPANEVSVLAAGVNTSTDVLTADSGTVYATGNPVKYTASAESEIGGLTIGTIYYVIKVTSSTFKLATTRQNAIDGTAIDLTAQSTGTSYFFFLNVLDYGATRMERTGAIALSEKPDLVLDAVVFGGEYFDSNSTSDYEHICHTVEGFRNIGYFITPKLTPDQVEELFNRGFLKNRRLKSGDKVIVKAKKADLDGVPVTTPQHSRHCNWTNAQELYTTANLSEAKTYIDAGGKLECEIISGAGAGQMSQITAINQSGTKYSLVLEDEIEGAGAGDICDIIIDNWEKFAEITDTDTDVNLVDLEVKSAPWVKFKVIMDGVDIRIQSFDVVNKPHRLAR